MLYRREHFSFVSFLFAIEKERKKPSVLHQVRHPGRGTAGLLVTNGGQPFGAEKPDGPVPGGHTGCPSKTCRWHVFESSGTQTGQNPQKNRRNFHDISKKSLDKSKPLLIE
jgi:hypothetical protein